MLFNSSVFLVFAAVFFALRPLFRGRNPRFAFIVLASFFFYGWWDWRYLILLLASGFVDFFAGWQMGVRPQRRKLLLGLSLLGNLGILGLFKYGTWVAGNFDALMASQGHPTALEAAIPPFVAVLPVGISFYTFQSLSYTIDIYRGQLKPTRNPLHFFCYLSMFPQLVAGPIVRAADILDQLSNPRRVDRDRIFDGLTLIARGFFKKVVIADTLAPFVDLAFSSGISNHGMLYSWIAVTAFAAQIYCDFSGYSDIAIGLARWMGFDFKKNFDHPYISTSLREFWTRWHISLSTWFRDYVYVPLGGNRCSRPRASTNLWVTMLASGLWHGAAWNFLAWGAVHALFLSVERLFGKADRARGEMSLPAVAVSVTLTMVFVWVGWVFFRAESIGQAFEILQVMFDPRSFTLADLGPISRPVSLVLLLFVGRELYVFLREKTNLAVPSGDGPVAQAVSTALLLVVCVFYRGKGDAFIYFQF
jgi:alginate O-acetyltransferase complex protein AlgI